MKFLINPLVWYLCFQVVGLVGLLSTENRRMRYGAGGLLLLTMLVAMASTPLSRHWLETSLEMKSTNKSAVKPTFIFVLSGGYMPGAVPEEDVLVTESQKRALHGATIWRHYPEASLVFSGGEYAFQDIRAVDRSVQLMAEVAQSRGVAAKAILQEAYSRNTREHPVEALILPGVTPATPIGIVTSSWHMRRAQQEFSRYFTQVQIYPVPAIEHEVNWQDLLPEASYLDANTTLLQEWIGILWYAILGPQEKR